MEVGDRADWSPDLFGKRIFITGGTGLFGKWMLEYFLASGSDLVLLTRNESRFRAEFPVFSSHSGLSFVEGDVRDFSFPEGRFDYVMHAATPVCSDDMDLCPDQLYSIITEGTQRALDFSTKVGAERFLYVSSGAVYGGLPPEITHISESFKCEPANAYGKGKLKAEQLCIESGLNMVIARCFAFVGPYFPLNSHLAVGNFIRNCLKNETIEILGDGTPMRSYMYGMDLAPWLSKILLSGASGHAYNVGSDQGISIGNLAHLVRDIAGAGNDVIIHEKADDAKFPSWYVPSIKKVNAELGLKIETNMEQAIEQTINWFRKR